MPKGGGGSKRKGEDDNATTRIAIVSSDRCKPKKCKQECKKNCPVNRQGKMCIEVKPTDKIAFISEILCIGCNICVKKCPFEAITIINLPKNLEASTTHRFGPNSFKLHRLPTPRANQVLGLVGTNGIGKSTALKILSGKQKPNLGNYQAEPDWGEILKYFRGNELQNYFQRLLEEQVLALMKPQYVDNIPKKFKDKEPVPISKLLLKKDDRQVYDKLLKELDLTNIAHREVGQLSGGELQRFAIAICAIRDADVYMFDEPSSYLDVKQRLKAGRVIRSLVSVEEEQRRIRRAKELNNNKNKPAYVIVVEHDLAVLDYLSDYICVLYGTPGVFGVVTMPFSVREGINIFLSGFLPTENMRFREFELNFKVSDSSTQEDLISGVNADGKLVDKKEDDGDDSKKKKNNNNDNNDGDGDGGGDDDDDDDDDDGKAKNKNKNKKEAAVAKESKFAKNKKKKDDDYDNEKEEDPEVNEDWVRRKGGQIYPSMKKTLGDFKLNVEKGYFKDSEIIVMLGENGTGKTTFVKMMAGLLKPDSDNEQIPELKVSYKPQKISPTFEGSVMELLHKRIRATYMHPQFQTDVTKPLRMDELFDQKVINLSGGELQRVALVLALGTPADVYLIDEPSAYLDSEQRIIAAKVIKRYILHAKKAAFVVEHDFIMATYLADRVIVFEGTPAKETWAKKPKSLLTGMNMFLKNLDVTFRRDPNNFRPRINKTGSVKDSEQKSSGNYFFLDADD